MSTQTHTQAKTVPKPTFTPASTGLLQRKCACGGTPGPDGECVACRQKRLALQRHAMPAHETAPSTIPPIVHDILSSPGQPLDTATRARMEPRFGHDFSRVRIHADGRAAESTQAVNATAYTVGKDIVFGSGQYDVHSETGRRLLTHELTHVVQQHALPTMNLSSIQIGPAYDSYEQEADNVATSSGGKRTVSAVQAAPAASLMRQTLSPAEIEERIRENETRLAQSGLPQEEADRLFRERQQLADQLAASRRGGSVPSSRRTAEAGGMTVSRPAVLPLQQAFTLVPLLDAPTGIVNALPEGQMVTIANPLLGMTEEAASRPTAITSPISGMTASVLTNIDQTLISSGFVMAEGGNAIGLIGIGRLGTPGAMVPESLSLWGHTAAYARVNGEIVLARGFMPNSMIQTALNASGVEAGTLAVPGRISGDIGLFTHTGARVIEFPVSAETATAFARNLPSPGTPPPTGPTFYTARPGVYGQPCTSTNCVAWATQQIENQVGGRIGTVGPRGEVIPLTEPVNPQAGLQGEFMKLTSAAEGTPEAVASLPGSTGPAVAGGMPRSLQFLKWGGRVFIVFGAVMVVVETARAPEGQRARTFAGASGGFAGGLAAGAVAGLACGPGAPVCSVVLGLGFGLGGYLIGRATAEAAYDIVNE